MDRTRLERALRRAIQRQTDGGFEGAHEIASFLTEKALVPEQFFADVALAYTKDEDLPPRQPNFQYEVNRELDADKLRYSRSDDEELLLTPGAAVEAALRVNNALREMDELSTAFGAPIFRLLGLRNLSSFVGETYKSHLSEVIGNVVRPNPVQDGYPDLMAMTSRGTRYFDEMIAAKRLTDKSAWSPYPYGGIEIKATCGDTPSARIIAKPELGDYRLDMVSGVTWKAHHRNTNNLLALWWDFHAGQPTILAAFFANNLTVDDWGKVIMPREGGGNTTSVSIIGRTGVCKLGDRWVIRPADPNQRARIAKKMASGRAAELF